jgi:hypothetical protein
VAPLDVAVTASASVTVDGAKAVAYSSQLPFKLSALELTLSGAKPEPSPQGPAISSTVALTNAPHARLRPPAGARHEVRLGLLAALVLCAGTTIVVWPASTASGDGAAEGPVVRTQAVGIHVASSTTQIRVADRAALEQVARHLSGTIVEGDDGWEGVVGRDALYWAVTAGPALTDLAAPPPAKAA